jgi:clan AA aspartic protease
VSTFSITFEVASAENGHFEAIDALVDTGASHTIFPGRFLRRLGIEPTERWPFRLADESQREYGVGQARLRIDGRECVNTVVFGDDDMTALLGAVTLEDYRLGVDPVGEQLVPVPGLLMGLLGSNPSPA